MLPICLVACTQQGEKPGQTQNTSLRTVRSTGGCWEKAEVTLHQGPNLEGAHSFLVGTMSKEPTSWQTSRATERPETSSSHHRYPRKDIRGSSAPDLRAQGHHGELAAGRPCHNNWRATCCLCCSAVQKEGPHSTVSAHGGLIVSGKYYILTWAPCVRHPELVQHHHKALLMHF